MSTQSTVGYDFVELLQAEFLNFEKIRACGFLTKTFLPRWPVIRSPSDVVVRARAIVVRPAAIMLPAMMTEHRFKQIYFVLLQYCWCWH